MESTVFWHLAEISDTQLRVALTDLLASGSRTESRIIAHLAEVDARKLQLKEGSESLYSYCIHVLHLSNSEAFYRITAARIAKRFPVVFTLIDQRQLHLTAVCLLRDYLTPENHRELLSSASHKTKWEVQELLARQFPRPEVQSRVRKLPVSRVAATPQLTREPIPSASTSACSLASVAVPEPLASEPPPCAPLAQLPRVSNAMTPKPIEPLSEARYRIQLNASAALKAKLDRLRAFTSHSNPAGDIALVIERALDIALERIEKQRFAKTAQPRRSARSVERAVRSVEVKRSSGPHQRGHVPNAVLREICERDEWRCTFRSESGCRCTARAFLQVHHESPWARGGDETVENLRLLCAAHNRLLAEQDFGAEHVKRRTRERVG